MNGTYALTAEDIATFREEGRGVLRGVLTAEEVARYAQPAREYVQHVVRNEAGLDAQPAQDVTTREVKTAYDLDDAPEAVRELVMSPRLGEIAAKLLGAGSVRVLHFSGHFKPVGAGPTGWHQDLAYIPLDTDDVMTIWVALSDVEPAMAPLVFAKGSHASRQPEEPDPARYRFVLNEPMRAGDVSMHTGWMVHGALPNRGEKPREAIAICYYRDGARVSTSRYIPRMDMFLKGCFAGLQSGDLAATPRNPVVYRSASA